LENRVIWDCSLSMKPVVRLVTILMIQHVAKDDETPESAYEQVKRRYGPLALSEPGDEPLIDGQRKRPDPCVCIPA
jgi:hypothetical protein